MIEASQDPKLLNTLKGHKDQITSLSFHPQGYIPHYSGNNLFLVLMIVWYSFGT